MKKWAPFTSTKSTWLEIIILRMTTTITLVGQIALSRIVFKKFFYCVRWYKDRSSWLCIVALGLGGAQHFVYAITCLKVSVWNKSNQNKWSNHHGKGYPLILLTSLRCFALQDTHNVCRLRSSLVLFLNSVVIVKKCLSEISHVLHFCYKKDTALLL